MGVHPYRYVIHDRDSIFSKGLDQGVTDLGVRVLRTPVRAPMAKGRIERSFGTAQDRLVKGLRLEKVKTMAQANRYLEEEFLPWWNQHLQVAPAHPADAHRPLAEEHDLAATLSEVHTRQVANDYTVRFLGKLYRLPSRMYAPDCAGAPCTSNYVWTGMCACVLPIAMWRSSNACRNPKQ